MKALLPLLGLLALSLTASAQQSSKEPWQNPEVNAINRLPMHADYFAFRAGESTGDLRQSASTGCATLTSVPRTSAP